MKNKWKKLLLRNCTIAHEYERKKKSDATGHSIWL